MMMPRTAQTQIALCKLLGQLSTSFEAVAVPSQERKKDEEHNGEAGDAPYHAPDHSLLFRRKARTPTSTPITGP